MEGLNKVMLIGNLGADPELRATPGGKAVANMRLATTDTWTDKAGEKRERTEWHRIVVWGKLAELCHQHLTKGRQVFVEGQLQTREWTDKENRKNFTTEVIATQVTFLGQRPDQRSADPTRTGSRGAATQEPASDGQPPPMDDADVPF
ncbi:single-stranded DNA-binding protein [Myxococcus llanfairpwllgwyngyllgogerychwyrndrobwllllantysiliogogogochensis]